MSSYLDWILYFKVIYVIQGFESKCAQYYVLLKGNNFREHKPVFINDIDWSFYNTSKEYTFFKENRDCFINVQCLNTESFCTKRGEQFRKYKHMVNLTERIETTFVNKEIEANKSSSKENRTTLKPFFRESTSEHTFEENISTSSSTLKDYITTFAPTFKENISTSATTVQGNESRSGPTFDGQGGEIDSAHTNWKTVGIAVASVVLTSLVLFIAMRQIRNCLQKQAYYLEDPHVADSGSAYEMPEQYPE